uniref:Uncharacterized protein n=1 Tax=Megaselia scalaris TaxID=36166 RepID=T1H3Q3_MEGSC
MDLGQADQNCILCKLHPKCVRKVTTKTFVIDVNIFRDQSYSVELTVEELGHHGNRICKIVQQETFRDEISTLRRGNNLRKSSHLRAFPLNWKILPGNHVITNQQE